MKDLNYIQALEKAVKEKYGDLATQNPKQFWDEVKEKELLFRSKLIHHKIQEIRGVGLLLAIQFDSFENNKKIIDCCIKNGLICDWFLFCDNAMRLAPPLIISDNEIDEACKIILKSIDEVIT